MEIRCLARLSAFDTINVLLVWKETRGSKGIFNSRETHELPCFYKSYIIFDVQ
jgi:hypothetical protein